MVATKLVNVAASKMVLLTLLTALSNVPHGLLSLIHQAGNRTHRLLHVERRFAHHGCAVGQEQHLVSGRRSASAGVTSMY